MRLLALWPNIGGDHEVPQHQIVTKSVVGDCEVPSESSSDCKLLFSLGLWNHWGDHEVPSDCPFCCGSTEETITFLVLSILLWNYWGDREVPSVCPFFLWKHLGDHKVPSDYPFCFGSTKKTTWFLVSIHFLWSHHGIWWSCEELPRESKSFPGGSLHPSCWG